jgi:hypothetical protein
LVKPLVAGLRARASAGLKRSVGDVSRIHFFYGIAIYMYWDEGIHARPQFHARYSGQVASVALDGEIIAGSLPPRAAALVAEWATLHATELEAPPAARRKMAAARRALIAACGTPSASSFHTLHGTATISGVGFFDVTRGQTGVAPDGIELHPVLGFRLASC